MQQVILPRRTGQPMKTDGTTPESGDDAQRQGSLVKAGLAAVLAAGAVGIAAHAAQKGNLSQFLLIGSGGVMIGGAALATGTILGFLFGIPRSLGSDASAPGTPGGGTGPAIQYRANTNLEQISDWFTKILVGVGLTQLSNLPAKLESLAASLSPLLGSGEAAGRFGVALCVYFGVAGFLMSYLWTRLGLGGALRAADLAGIGERTARVEQKILELENQAVLDAKALSLTNVTLNPSADTPPPTQEELNQALRAASQSVRVQIFYRAQEVRATNWAKEATKPIMARTIPLFRALIACDSGYHRNHAQLGYALKDQVEPEWQMAEKALTRAIELRGDPKQKGWLFYDFNRAVCRIHLDPECAAKKPSSEGVRRAILEDLRAAALSAELKLLIQREPTIGAWLKLNQVTEKELG